MNHHAPNAPGLQHASYPVRDLELATHLSTLHHRTVYHLSASECETLALSELLALADPADAARWDTLRLGYTDPRGASWLRAAAAQGYATLGPDQLVCFAGAQEALFATMHALLSPGDHAIVILPSYQSIETLAVGLCDVSGVALDPAAGWSLDIDAVAAAIRPTTRVVAISFPNNPTGHQLPPARYAALVALCRHRGIWLISDEVYRLTERDPAQRLPAAADVYERGVSLGVLSKAYGLPGLRIGWVACQDAALLDRVATMRQYLSTCSAGPSEVLATIALKSPSLLARNRALAEANLLLLLAFLARHPQLFATVPPAGGMVCYPSWTGPGTVNQFTAAMAEAGVLLVPASVFRSALLPLPTGHFRVGYGRASFPAGLAAWEQALAAII